MSTSELNNSPQWLAVYTAPRHEKQVAKQLQQRGVENFLPTYEALRQWKTGPARVQMPLFPSYLFVHAGARERRITIELASVLHIVRNGCEFAAIAEQEIERLRVGLASGKVEPYPYLTVGTRVRINKGPLTDVEGVLVRRAGRFKVVVSVELIHQAFAVEVGIDEVERCGDNATANVANPTILTSRSQQHAISNWH
jgi:transcription antitermination factor NusG